MFADGQTHGEGTDIGGEPNSQEAQQNPDALIRLGQVEALSHKDGE